MKIPINLYNCGQMLNDIQHYNFNLYNIIFLGLLSVFNTVLHEMGHAVFCTKFGGKVTSMGLMLFFFFPCFFVDVSDIYMLNSRKKSIYVAASGLMVNIAVGSMLFYMYYILSLFNVHATTLLIFYCCNFGNVIYNLIPFVKLDGYWIFSAAIKVTNLIEKSVIIFFTMLFRFNEYCNINVSKPKKMFLACWGFACIIFRPIFWLMSTCTIRNFISNIPYEISAIAILLFLIIVLYSEIKFILYHVKRFKSDRENVLKMI